MQETLASLKGEEETYKFVNAQRVELLQANAAGVVKEWSLILPDVDKKVLTENDDIGTSIVATLHEGLKNSSDG